ncbi:hypothetical protein ABGB18_32135 [Nonomuraea sp. B12E4]|uniref:hypothetical protein n=1 Tax=Nonomuraea sp. B12E4 TaxID=3153564 RepID=UPI00325F860A
MNRNALPRTASPRALRPSPASRASVICRLTSAVKIVATGMGDLERITSEPTRVGSITTDLVYEIVADRATPLPGRPG